MELNKLTYEAFLLDYQEGNLSKEECQQLFSFVNKHPELQEDLINITNNSTLKPKKYILHEKQFLKKKDALNVSKEYFDELCIKKIENELSISERIYLNRLVNESDTLKSTLNQFEKIVLTPTKVNFPLKSKLKKEEKLVFAISKKTIAKIINVSSAAAVIISFYLNYNKATLDNNETLNTLPIGESKMVVSNLENKFSKSNVVTSELLSLGHNNEKISNPTSVFKGNHKKAVKDNTVNYPKKQQASLLQEAIIEEESESFTLINTEETTSEYDTIVSAENISLVNNKGKEKSNTTPSIKSNKGTIWGFAKRIIEGISGRKVKVKYKESTDGDVYAYSIEDDNFSIKHIKSKN